jgi:hypothetical protein
VADAAAPPAAPIVPGPTAPRSAGSSSSGGGSSGSLFDADVDEGVVLLLFALLLAVIFGAGIYLVYQAPAILTEAAFEAVLASGLVKASRRMTRAGWMGSIFRSTWVPFAIVLAMAIAFGFVAKSFCPDAAKISDVLAGCKTRPRG